jgi:hypothetical protein
MTWQLIDGVIANDAFATPATPGTSQLVDGINNQAFASAASATAQPVDAVLGLTTWVSAGGPTAYADTLSVGGYAVAGKTASDSVARSDAAAAGAYALSGKTVSDAVGRVDALAKGSYSIAGQLVTDVVTTGGGSVAYADSLSAGSYALSGKALTDSKAVSDSLAVGAYVLTGKAIADSLARLDALAKGSYVYTGLDLVDVKTGVTAYADDLFNGSYLVTGQSIDDLVSGDQPVKVGGDDAPHGYKKRYQVQVKDKVHLFESDQEAVAYLNSLKKKVQKRAVVKQIDPAYTAMMQAILEADLDEQDIEDILMLL